MKRFNKLLSLLLIVTFILSNTLTSYNVLFAESVANSDSSQNIDQNDAQQQSPSTNAISLSDFGKSAQDAPVNQFVYSNPDKKDDAKDKSDKDKNQKKNKRILIKYKDDSMAETVKAKVKQKLSLSKLDTKKKGKRSKLESVEIGENDDVTKTIKELKKDDNVLSVQEDFKLFSLDLPTDQSFTQQWGLFNNGQTISGQSGNPGYDIRVLNAWDVTTGSENVIVGILDSGIDINHNDLKNNIYTNMNEISGNRIDDDNNGYIDDINGWNFVNNDNTVFDSSTDDMHGTHVAGIIAASENNDGIVGVSPNVKILPLKFISGSYGYTSDAIEAIEYAKLKGVKIINCSWGGSEYNDALKSEMESSGILFICAAGNSGGDTSANPIYPASFGLPNIISVAAVNNKGELASFSSYGGNVNVAAPGVNILSTLPGNTYGTLSGTSMATAYVTGVAALLQSQNSNLSAPQTKARIEQSTLNYSNLTGKVTSGGIIDADYALSGKVTTGIVTTVDEGQDNTSSIGTQGGNFDYTDVYPFSIENGKFIDQDSAFPSNNIQVILTEKDDGLSVYNEFLRDSNREIVLDKLLPDKEYVLNVTIDKGSIVNSYSGKVIAENNSLSQLEIRNVIFAICGANGSVITPQSDNGTVNPLLTFTEKEPNDLPDSQPTLENSDYSDYFNISGNLSSSIDNDWYKVKFAYTGKANFYISNLPDSDNYKMQVYDQSVLYTTLPGGETPDTKVTSKLLEGLDVIAGRTYYVHIKTIDGCDPSKNYNLQIKNYSARLEVLNGGSQLNNGTVSPGTTLTVKGTGMYLNHIAAFIKGPSDSGYTCVASNVDGVTHGSGNNFTYTFTPNTLGMYSIYLVGNNKPVGDSDQLLPESDKFYFMVSLPVPTVTLTSPASGTTYNLNQPITISATGTNCDHISAFSNGTFISNSQQSGNNYSFIYNPTATGTYNIYVVGRNVPGSSGGTSVQSDTRTVTVSASPVTLNGITTDKASPQKAGTSIVISANASGGTQRLYQFWIRKTTTSWQIVQDYSTSNTYTWTPTDLADYFIEVHVKDKNSSNSFDDFKDLNYTIANIATAKLSGVTLDKASPQVSGTAIKITANATSGSQVLYQFWVRKTTTSWQIVQDYSTSNTFTWTPTDIGNYFIEIHVKDVNSSNSFDDFTDLSYTIANMAPAKLSGVTLDKASPQVSGTAIKVTANATSGSQVLYQFWVRKTTTSWQIVQDYSTSNTFTWTPTDIADYFIEIHVKDINSSNSFDDFKDLSYSIVNLGTGNLNTGEEYLNDLAAELGVTAGSNSVTFNGKTFVCDSTNSRYINGKYAVTVSTFAQFFTSSTDIYNRLVALTPSGFDLAGVASVDNGNSVSTMDTSPYLDTAAYGQYSTNVKNIQLALQKLGYWTNPSLKATGYFGEVTRLSLINFEKNYLKLTDSDISYVNGNFGGYTTANVQTLGVSDYFQGVHKFIANKLDEIANSRVVQALTIAGNFYLGEMDAVEDTAKGIWTCVQHPIRTGEGIVFLIKATQEWSDENIVMKMVIVQSLEQAKNDFSEGDANKRARMIGKIVGEIVLCVVGTKGTTAALDAIKVSANSGRLGVLLGRIGSGIAGAGDDAALAIDGIAEATPETISLIDSILGRIETIRAALPSALRRSGNMALADLQIESLPSELKAFSQVNYATDTCADQGFVLLKDNRTFTTMSINGYDRAYDTEAKILEEVASSLGNNTDATGTIRLLTENPPCDSCQSVFRQFRQKYPNIKLKVLDGMYKVTDW